MHCKLSHVAAVTQARATCVLHAALSSMSHTQKEDSKVFNKVTKDGWNKKKLRVSLLQRKECSPSDIRKSWES